MTIEFSYTNDTINNASENGHVDILEWVHNSEYEFKYNARTISDASKNGHINVLEWFHKSDYEFLYDEEMQTEMRLNRVGVANAADRGIDIISNFGPIIQVTPSVTALSCVKPRTANRLRPLL